ncbi:MAG: hypothetical protein KDC27_18955 [Acidobacteria bacterium]|nr:hypothetical protein [Acidobacteriota bacterium]
MLQDPYEVEVNPYFRSWGVEGTALGLTSRRFEGERAGRRFVTLLSPRRRTRYAGDIRTTHYQGHTVDIAVSVSPRTRFVAALAENANRFSRYLNRRSGVHPVPLPAGLEHLEIWAAEPDWAARWLAVEGVGERIARLLAPDARSRMRNVALSPLDGLSYKVSRIHLRTLTGDDLHGWLADLYALAAAVDSVEPPRAMLEPTWMEKKAKESPWLLAVGVLAALFAVVAAAGLLFTGALVGLAYLLSKH